MLGVRNRDGSGRDPLKVAANHKRWREKQSRLRLIARGGWLYTPPGTYCVSVWSYGRIAVVIVAGVEFREPWRLLLCKRTPAGRWLRGLLADGIEPERGATMAHDKGLLFCGHVAQDTRQLLTDAGCLVLACGVQIRGRGCAGCAGCSDDADFAGSGCRVPIQMSTARYETERSAAGP